MNRAVTALASDSAATIGKIRPVLSTHTTGAVREWVDDDC